MITVRGTAFAPEPLEGGSASIEKAPEGNYKSDLVEWVSQELSKSDRPELTSAKNIVSGGINFSSNIINMLFKGFTHQLCLTSIVSNTDIYISLTYYSSK